MTITVGGTSITFNDATTQTTAAVAGVTSVAAGTGISLSGSTGAVTITNTNTSSGTVTSVATGNGLSGGTITSTGTLTLGSVAYNTIGGYTWGATTGVLTVNGGSTVAAGGGSSQLQAYQFNGCGGLSNQLSGTWRFMAGNGSNAQNYALWVRIA